MRIAVVGAGRVGTALAVQWLLAGHDIAVAVHREPTKERHDTYLADAAFMPADEAARTADAVVIGVPDSLIHEVCSSLAKGGAFHEGQSVLHLSGATDLGALEPAWGAGARVLALHPLQTFPDVESAIGRMAGTAMAVTARDDATAEIGEQLARDAGGRPFRLTERDKPLYHAAAVFASNYLVTVIAEAEALFDAIGIGDPLDALIPLAQASLENVAGLGPGKAITGPVVRGDAATVRSNLEALAERELPAVGAYIMLARLTLQLAARSGRLAEQGRTAVEEVLAEWSK